MPRTSKIVHSLPKTAAQALQDLGANLRLARNRRALSIRAMAEAIGVSPPSVIAMERGDPGTSMAIYLAGLAYFDRAAWLPDLMRPDFDREALQIELAGIRPRVGTRSGR
jgi:DNA-binding XRE family transcriptional regulator